MKLALYKGKGMIGNALIRWWTKSIYSHCELVLSDGYSYSSSLMDGGVRRKKIEFNPDHWDFIDLPWAQEFKVLEFYEETKYEPYGWVDLIFRQIFNRPGDSFGWFCSEWCAKPLNIPNAQMYSPATLGDFCRHKLEY